MKETLYLSLYRDLAAKIKSGFYAPGQKLPTEIELTALYRVSRVTAAHAMRELERNHYVFRKQKSGTFVYDYLNVTGPENDNRVIPVLLPFDQTIGRGIILGTQSTAALNSMTTVFCHTQNSVKTERYYLEKMLSSPLAGLILSPCSAHENLDVLAEYKRRGIPLVFLHQPIMGIDAPCILSDNELGTYRIVSELIRMGHRRIAYFPYYVNMPTSEAKRFGGYYRALVDHDCVADRKMLFVGSPAFSSKFSSVPVHRHRDLTAKLIDAAIDFYAQSAAMPTAIVCANDVTAHDFILKLRARGYRVPEDISIAGFDNLEFSDLDVGITTVQQDLYNLGAIAVEELLELEQNKPVPKETLLEVKYVEKTSTRSIQNCAEQV